MLKQVLLAIFLVGIIVPLTVTQAQQAGEGCGEQFDNVTIVCFGTNNETEEPMVVPGETPTPTPTPTPEPVVNTTIPSPSPNATIPIEGNNTVTIVCQPQCGSVAN